MRFHADLHVHSKYSRATSRDLDLEHLAEWAARKGIGLVGTGDFTHPAWANEIKSKLVPAEPGLFRLRDDIERAVAERLPPACRVLPRFMLEVEISTIYKKGEKTRKIHHLIYAPDLATMDRFSAKLATIGNIASDGRPILGLDSRDLLEITLDSGPGAYLIPAHIWTPWFAALGSMSGFDSIEECYGDLASHIFAVETGLSSDPAMNWRVPSLDRFRLVSNSDAHSPGKLGREATAFDCELGYFAIRHALETGEGYVGTVEFYPEEGKYHLDGHRNCGVRFEPKETLAHGGLCPSCGKPLTVGVLHRVEALAGRSEEEAKPPATAGAAVNLVPLPEMISEIASSGVASRKVVESYERTLSALGPELPLLEDVPIEDIARADALLGEAVARLRAGKVIREAGYDGEYGVIRLFEDGELSQRTKGALLFDAPVVRRKTSSPEAASLIPPPARGRVASEASRVGVEQPRRHPHPAPSAPTSPFQGEVKENEDAAGILGSLDADQRKAAETAEGPLLIVAGPGSGKTRTLTHRIAHLVADCGMAADACLAVTFTRRAAAEMRGRLAQLLPAGAKRVAIHTFHSLGLAILREHAAAAGLNRGFRIASQADQHAILTEFRGIGARKIEQFLRAISRAKRTGEPPDEETVEAFAAYQRGLLLRNLVDFDDLVRLAVKLLSEQPEIAAALCERLQSISVDEFQDIDEQQYRLIRLLAPDGRSLCVIGDPDQAIYGFRGADASCFERFRVDYPNALTIELRRNYRSSGTIISAAAQVIGAGRERSLAEVVREMHERITLHAAPTDRAEAEYVVQTIEGLIGGHNFFSIDTGRANGEVTPELSFSDFAVLYRTDAQSAALVEALARSGIPFKKHSHAPLADEPAVRALLDALYDQPADAPLAERLRTAAARLRESGTAADAALPRLLSLAETCERNGTRFADVVAVASEADFFDPRADRVSLLTLHAAKGLEFPVVFIVGLEDGILPLHWGERDEATLAEERRLFYVGMTRAKDRLFLSRAGARQWRGNRREFSPSPFLADIERELLRHQAPRSRPPREEDRQLSLF
ncbi:MAG: UvrD-helicase domain-containing protein [Bradyrhizobiaceae bacterium]|nr:UvrD-helicase domain-containing protein [Bradyrhizobiaceae bacterium]